jgi:hypothetical protein
MDSCRVSKCVGRMLLLAGVLLFVLGTPVDSYSSCGFQLTFAGSCGDPDYMDPMPPCGGPADDGNSYSGASGMACFTYTCICTLPR